MKIDLSGKTAAVSGSTAGIGLAIAMGLAATGARVVVNGRSQESVDAALAQLAKAVPEAKAEGVAADLATAEGAAAFIARVPGADILVNNVGIYALKPFADITDDEWLHYFDVNIMSGVRLSRHYLPAMVRRDWGRIVFVSSESGLNIPTGMIHYGMTKAAQLAIARGLAQSVAGTGVTVNSVLPGPTLTEGVAEFIGSQARERGVSSAEMEKLFMREERASSLIRRFESVDEVANMVVYACSRQASGTTGAALRVDGGIVSYIV